MENGDALHLHLKSIIMKALYLSFLLVLAMHTSSGQSEKIISANIKEVTVFTQGAQITREGSIAISRGESIIKVVGLSPFVNPKSINVKGEGEFTILSVSHRLNHLNETIKNERVDSLNQLIEKLEVDRTLVNNKQLVLAEKKSLLDANKQLAGDNGLSISELKIAVDFYESQIQSIKKSNFENESRLKDIEKEIIKLRKQIGAISTNKTLPTSEIFIKVRSVKSVTGNFRISYPVENAGWFPKYDIRVKDVNSKLKLEYKADVFQSTGVDWNHVKLKLSTADPNKSGLLPKLNTWHLNFARNTIYRDRDYSNPSALFYDDSEYRIVRGRITDDTGEALPGVNVLVKGTTRGTTTNLDGYYELTVSGDDNLVYSYVGFETQEVEVGGRSNVDITLGGATELQEVVVTGYGIARSNFRIRGTSTLKAKSKPITTSIVQNTTSFSFEVEKPYSIMSTGEKLTVDLKHHEIEAMYAYYAIPKLDSDAFLIAQVADWNNYSLLEGEANLFFEGTFVGNTILNPKAFKDTLDISLGRDKSVIISRESVEEFRKSRSLGSNKIDTRSYKTLVKSNKHESIRLTIYDQIPVSVISDINVTAKEISDGQFEEEIGKVTWVLDLQPNQQSEKILTYEVKYPKREQVILE